MMKDDPKADPLEFDMWHLHNIIDDLAKYDGEDLAFVEGDLQRATARLCALLRQAREVHTYSTVKKGAPKWPSVKSS